ncbi:MAG TPA: DUF5671 domain-containing protein [Candidatus Acidoferrum sp.]|nr:DUF5671 domain-containing protein [Candidatus Acidoferrum sp.]
MTTSSLPAGEDLDRFIRTAKDHGLPDDALVALLQQNGWSPRRIYRGLSAYYTETLGLAPPQRGSRGESPRDAFLYLLNFITLGFWTIALGQLFYALIARWFPDPASSGYPGSLTYEIAWQLATIMIAFPAFSFVARAIGKELQRRPEAAESPVRAWLTYVALVIAAIVVLLDGIWFLEALLRGEITIRFLLDTLVLLVLGGGVFGYYLSGLHSARTGR